MDLFLAIIGAEAGYMGLRALATGGVYLCGGITPKARAPAAAPFCCPTDSRLGPSTLSAGGCHAEPGQVSLHKRFSTSASLFDSSGWTTSCFCRSISSRGVSPR